MNKPLEEWRDTNVHNLFVSSFGRVRRFGTATHIRGWYEYFGTNDGRGYRTTSDYETPRGLHKVHRLVAMAFIPNPLGYKVINHKNAIKTDNRVENLEWCDHKLNIRHARSLGLFPSQRGVNNGNNKLTEDDVKAIFIAANGGSSLSDLAKRFGVTPGMIYHIRNRSNWRHVTDALVVELTPKESV